MAANRAWSSNAPSASALEAVSVSCLVSGGGQLFFDMASPQGEQANLLAAPLTPAQTSAYDFLKSKMKKLIES
jgi:hypothetical protein